MLQTIQDMHDFIAEFSIVQSRITELTKSIVKVLVLGFLSCIGIGIGIVKSIFQVLVLVLVLLRAHPKYWYWYWYWVFSIGHHTT